jgi:chaperonin GroEL (HSP60 family)
VSGREQLAMQAFADALEGIPKALAENSGMDSIDTRVLLRSKHKAKGGEVYGVDVLKGGVGDMAKLGVVEPTRVIEQAIKSASEAAEIVLRIDDMISGKGKSAGAPPGGPGGAPEY